MTSVSDAREAALTFGRFAWRDVRATLGLFARTAGVALAVLAVCVLGVLLSTGATSSPSFRQSPGLSLVVWLVASLYYAALPALAVGLARAGWRLFGWTIALPMVTFPLATWAAFALGWPLLSSRAHALAEAFLAAGRVYGWPVTQSIGRLAHAGPVALPFILAAVIFDGVHLLGDGRVFGALLWLLVVMATLSAVAAVLCGLLTLPPMAWVFVRRARARWERYRAGEA